jgi:hypothetical protein
MRRGEHSPASLAVSSICVKRVLIARGCQSLILVALAIGFAVSLDAADNIIVPGIRCSQYILGKTTEDEVRAMPAAKGLDFQYSRNGVLDSIVLTTRDYHTDRQVSVGVTEDDVVRAYGRGKVGIPELSKGTRTDGSREVVGRVGDKAILYPGIEFIFFRQQVWAIVVMPKP